MKTPGNYFDANEHIKAVQSRLPNLQNIPINSPEGREIRKKLEEAGMSYCRECGETPCTRLRWQHSGVRQWHIHSTGQDHLPGAEEVPVAGFKSMDDDVAYKLGMWVIGREYMAKSLRPFIFGFDAMDEPYVHFLDDSGQVTEVIYLMEVK